MKHNFIIVAIVAFVVVGVIHGFHLIGEHVCIKNETYTVTFGKHVKKNVTRREFVWCMSVPPRCSKYITQEVDAIEVVEKERIKTTDICCDGYIEDQKTCIPECKTCANGVCTAPETCSCFAGFSGASCNQTCESGFWGQNCSKQCTCVNQASCSPDTGRCACSPGTTGPKCEISLSFNNVSNCTVENCDSLQEAIKNGTKASDIIMDVSTESTGTILASTASSSTSKPEATTHFQVESREIIDNNASIAKSKKNFNSIGKTHQFSDKEADQWQMDQILIENNSDNSVKDTVLVFVISIAVGTAVILILITIMTIIIARYKKQRDLAIKKVLSIKSSIDNNNKNRLSTEPIIQRSVFHAPLPDPPIFQNPIFILQDMQNIDKIQRNYLSDTLSAETQSQYDFPPSSGSYRAVSLPDPCLETVSEPVYDEIPAFRRPRPVTIVPESIQSCCVNAHCQWNNT